MGKMKVFCIVAGAAYLSLFVFNLPALKAEENSSTNDLSLADIPNISTSVASKKETTIREAPGIVTVITDDDIQKMGARDLIDVLQTVPGFTLALDVQGIVDVGIRGNWAHEGKTLYLFDGHEMNELDFATNQLGNHYPVDQIKKIEIISGSRVRSLRGVCRTECHQNHYKKCC